MREALLRKRYGIPALFLVGILLTAGIAVAALVATIKFETTTAEPLTFNKIDGLDITYQGDADTITVNVSNASTDTGYGILVNNTLVDGQVKSVSYSNGNLFASEPDDPTNFNNDGDTVDAKYNIGPGASIDIVVTIDSADDAEPGEVEVTLDFHRTYKYV